MTRRTHCALGRTAATFEGVECDGPPPLVPRSATIHRTKRATVSTALKQNHQGMYFRHRQTLSNREQPLRLKGGGKCCHSITGKRASQDQCDTLEHAGLVLSISKDSISKRRRK